jgi:hypothetical protein
VNIWDIVIIVAVLGIAIFGTIRLKKKKGGCHGSCCSCCEDCSKKNKNENLPRPVKLNSRTA